MPASKIIPNRDGHTLCGLSIGEIIQKGKNGSSLCGKEWCMELTKSENWSLSMTRPSLALKSPPFNQPGIWAGSGEVAAGMSHRPMRGALAATDKNQPHALARHRRVGKI